MEVRRTVPIKFNVADSDADLLHETISEFLWAANYVVDHAWQGEYKTTSKAELQRETYDDVRAETRLQANLVQNARNKAADAVQSVVARWKQGDYAGKPNFTAPTLVYDKRCATFNDDHATLSTVEGRITAEYVLPDENRKTPHSEYLYNDDYEVTGAELHYRDGEFYLHVRTKADVEFETADDGNGEHSTVLGVDLGIENIAVTSTGTFWNGAELNHGTASSRSGADHSTSAGRGPLTKPSSRSGARRRGATITFYTPSLRNSSRKPSNTTVT